VYLVTRDDWRAIIRRAVEQAREGNAEARAWLASYLPPPLGGGSSTEALVEMLSEMKEIDKPAPEGQSSIRPEELPQ
jgi:hypothetical protein